MSFRVHPFAAPARPLAGAPSPFACGVCGHYALREALHEQALASAVPEPPRMVCQVCGAHAVPWARS